MPNCNVNFNNCCAGPYYPRPIYRQQRRGSCGGANNIINPVRSEEWGFFVGQTATVASGEALPIFLSGSVGSAVKYTAPDTINLTGGSYQISYSVTASATATPVEFAFEVNGVIFEPSRSTATINNTTQSLTNTVIFTVPSNSIIRLINLTGGVVNIVRSNVAVTKLLN